MTTSQNLDHQYIEHLLQSQVLRFGEFKTKAGRLSPYFLDSGRISSGEQAAAIGKIYARKFIEAFGRDEKIILFGPAYKGIGLAVTTALFLSQDHQLNLRYCYNRKEAKDHGEGGQLIGYPLQPKDRVVIVEDVLSRGTSLRDSIELLDQFGAEVCGLLVGVDREEKGFGSELAREEIISKNPQLKFCAITNVTNIVATLHNRPVLGQVWIDDQRKQAIDSYRAQHG